MPLPKSATPSRQAENLDVFGFESTDAEVAAISGLTKEDGRLFGGDPTTHEEMQQAPFCDPGTLTWAPVVPFRLPTPRRPSAR